MGWSWWLCCPLTQYPTLQHLPRAVNRAFPDFGVAPGAAGNPCVQRRGHHSQTQFHAQPLLGRSISLPKPKSRSRCCSLGWGCGNHTQLLCGCFWGGFTREIVAVGPGAFLERRSQLDLPNTSMDLWAFSSSFSFPPSHGLWFYVILCFKCHPGGKNTAVLSVRLLSLPESLFSLFCLIFFFYI